LSQNRTAWAAVILTHGAPDHLFRLVDALAGVPIVLHCDVKTAEESYQQIRSQLADRALFVERRDTRHAGWSLVDAELAALELAVTGTEADHIAILSGSDYPLAAPARIRAVLAALGERSWILNRPLPFPEWDAPGFPDGGLWRVRHYFPTRNNNVLFVAGKPVFVPLRRRIPADYLPRLNPQWKIYSRRDAVRLLRVLADREDLVRFGRHMFTPEEGFIASVMASPRLFGDDALQTRLENPWRVNWPGHRTTHPSYYTDADVSVLEEAATRSNDTSREDDAGVEDLPYLFARKFPLDSAYLVDAIRSTWEQHS